MRRVALALIVGLFAVPAGTLSASAAPIDVTADPGDRGVTVTVTVLGIEAESIDTGQLAVEEGGQPGLCASGLIHTSCTPASEAGGQ